jgi:hypothetical protein
VPTYATPTVTVGTSYQPNADRDTLVVVGLEIATGAAGAGTVQLLSDAADPPTAVADQCALATALTDATFSLTALVKKGHYFKLVKTDDAGTPTYTVKSVRYTHIGGTGVVEGAASADVLLYNEQQTDGTDGGTFTADTWQTRLLNTEVLDAGGHGSLASNQITLAAGTYEVWAWAVAHRVEYHKTRLYNITDSATILVGTAAYATAGNVGNSTSHILGQFVLAASKAIALQHLCSDTKSTDGFGIAGGLAYGGGSSGEVEVYSQVFLRKVA